MQSFEKEQTMLRKMRYAVIRLMIFAALGFLVAHIAGGYVEGVTVPAKWIVGTFVMIGIAQVATQLYLNRILMKSVKEDAASLIQKIKRNFAWQSLESTIAALRQEYVFSNFADSTISSMEKNKREIEEKIAYLEGDWQNESVAPSLMEDQFNNWRVHPQELEEMEKSIQEPHTLLHDIRKVQEDFKKYRARIGELVEFLRDNPEAVQRCGIPDVVQRMIASEVELLEDSYQTYIRHYGEATTLEDRSAVVEGMKRLSEFATLVSDITKLLSGVSEPMMYAVHLAQDKKMAIMFRLCHRIFDAYQEKEKV